MVYAVIVEDSPNPLSTSKRKRRLALNQDADAREPELLPSGIFLIDRLVTSRPSKTRNVFHARPA